MPPLQSTPRPLPDVYKRQTLCYAENGVVTPVLPRAEVKLRGLHNVENLLAAIAAVWGRVPVDVMRQVGSTFTGVEHRIEPVRVLDGVTYYNDSIASSRCV